MDMIAMLSGLGVTPGAVTGPGYGYGSGQPSARRPAPSYGSSSGTASSTPAAPPSTLDAYLKAQGVLVDLPALPKPSKPVAMAPFNPAKPSEEVYLASIGAPAGGKIPTPDDLILAANKKMRDVFAAAPNDTTLNAWRRAAVNALLMGQGAALGSTQFTAWEVQLAAQAIVESASRMVNSRDVFNQAYALQQAAVTGPWESPVGIFKTLYNEVMPSVAQAYEILRSLAAGRHAEKALMTGGGFTRPDAVAATVSRPLYGLGAINYPGGFVAVQALIKDNPAVLGAAIIAAARRFLVEGRSARRWTPDAAQVAQAIAQGLVIQRYADIATNIALWRAARGAYSAAATRYGGALAAWRNREAYRTKRIKAIESFYTAVGTQGAAALAAEAQLKKDRDDAAAAKAAADAAAADLRSKVDALNQQIASMTSGDPAAKTAIEALNATIEQLKAELAAAQSQASASAQSAADTAAQSASNGTLTSGGAAAANETVQTATDTAQTAEAAAASAGEAPVAPVAPGEQPKKASATPVIIALAALGGFIWWRTRRPSAP